MLSDYFLSGYLTICSRVKKYIILSRSFWPNPMVKPGFHFLLPSSNAGYNVPEIYDSIVFSGLMMCV
ncbi:MAG: hypothetical protein GTO13_07995 [Proteobacteria bacterium]|nr:hypothetical protein [Pseudomonadota bacterium]